MSTLAKQVVSVFFGATDQDTSKTGVKLGDLVQAQNCEQVKGGEYTKRLGFTASAQVYAGAAGTPDTLTSVESVVSPDGVQVITRDAATDTVYARTTDAAHNAYKGDALRIAAKTSVRFASTVSGHQAAPMAKQAGNYYVYLSDPGALVVALRSSNSGAILRKVSVPISYGSPYPSTHVSSFAVVDNATFDATSIWIYWVDWTTNAGAQQDRDSIRAVKIAHDFSATSFYRLTTPSALNECYTSICASVTSDGYVTLGVTVAHDTDGNDVAFRDFRASASAVSTGLLVCKYDATPSIKFSSQRMTTPSALNTWTASGVCALTVAGSHSHHTGICRFAFWGSNTSNRTYADLMLASVDEATGDQSWLTLDTATNVGHLSAFTDSQPNTLPYFVGSVTGHDTASGVVLAAQIRVYYQGGSAGQWVDPATDVGTYADTISTTGYVVTDAGSVHKTWTAGGAWLAHGWFPYYISGVPVDVLITGWQDTETVQMPYHLRRLDTGAIIAPFALGQGAFAGGTARDNAQITNHVCDLNQPTSQASGATSNCCVLSLQAANVSGSADIASVSFSRNMYQPPASFRGLALYPGPIPTIVSGWQNLRETAPLSYPSQLRSFWGRGSS